VEIQLGDYAAAREHADRAVSLDADSAANRGTRCFALVGVGDFKAARADCARAVELNAASAVDRGMLAFLDHRYDDARKSWAAASESPADARALAPWVAKLPHR
jgi:Flp pilus assembly protein TadD